MNQFYGLPVYINDMLGWKSSREQVRFPRSKKRRIRNKWARQEKNYLTRKWQEAEAYQMGNRLIMNSVAYNALKKKVAQ